MEENLTPYSYEGTELELFSQAKQWKSYFSSRMHKFTGAEVLEIGPGIGGTTQSLFLDRIRRWVCLEPDPVMADILIQKINNGILPSVCEVVNGSLPTPSLRRASFDTIFYIDVLEHISEDQEELCLASTYLRKNGYLIVLSPAHNWLFSPFDRVLGHFRRYSRRSIKSITPHNTRIVAIEYLDSVGLFASLANSMLLKQETPTPVQIAFWDKAMVPFSRIVDPLIGRCFGKSILAVWQKIDN